MLGPKRLALPLLVLVVLLGLTVLPSAAGSGSAAPGCAQAPAAGTSTQTIAVGGTRRTYLLVVPGGLTAGTPVPVIMGLHGGSGTAAQASRYMSLTSDRRALYVYPQAPYWPEVGGVAWNVDPAGVDFPYFDALLADLKARHCVDPARIFAAGKSNGAFMVNALACYRPGVFRAIAPVAGGGPQTSRCPQGVAAIIVHGSADRTVPIRSGRWTRDYWLARNGNTGAAPVPTTPSPCVTHPGSPKPVLWCQHPGAHTWPTWTGPAIRDFFLGL